MTVKGNKVAQPVRLENLQHKLYQTSIIGAAVMQLVAIIVATIVISNFANRDNFVTIVVATVTAIACLEMVGCYLLIKFNQYSLDIVLRALIQLSNEQSSTTPPNRNNISNFFRPELATALDIIYDQKRSPVEAPTPVNKKEFTVNMLNALPVGVIVLNSNLEIIASNQLAPIIEASDGRHIQLDFSENSQSLEKWLTIAAENSISAEKVWTRIQNIPAGSVGERHIYDVIASYHRNAANDADTVIVTVDRTSDYVDDENTMDFVALAAHELRGPITVIRGYLDMLDEEMHDKLSPEQQQLMDRLNVSARRLASYVNNILNVSRYDRRHLKLKLKEVEVTDIIADIIDDMNLRASTVGRQVVWHIPPGLPTVAADRSSISEVLINLIDNAIKYSYDQGIVEVGAQIDGNYVALFVKDNGIGIPSSVSEHLFSKFYRSHRSSGQISGSGLGLYISRAIVESHGGHIGVESTEGRGSLFTFTLPIYASVADKLRANGDNAELINDNTNWIKNHGVTRE